MNRFGWFLTQSIKQLEIWIAWGTVLIAVSLLSTGCDATTPVETDTATATVLLTPASMPQATRDATPTPSPSSPPSLTPTWTPTSIPGPTFTPTSTPTPSPTPSPEPDRSLFDKFEAFTWIAYAPTQYNPDQKITPSVDDIMQDLQILYEAGFRGLVTYGASGILAEIPKMARQVGFEGIVMGIWTPDDDQELEAAEKAMSYVDGYAVGNEGLFFDRYTFGVLEQSIIELRERTGKPVTTSEVFSLYYEQEELLSLGDWVFPTVHPYWASITEPAEASDWTLDAFNNLQSRAADTMVVLKEVGLPTEGAPRLSEYRQAEYYTHLRESATRFVYFEAYDQLWKVEDGVGAHWGLFRSDRTLKPAAEYLVRGYPPVYVYADAGSPDNHFVPEGWMGCHQGVTVDEDDQTQAFLGSSAIKISYVPQPRCKDEWAGIYWWHPPGGDWCTVPGGFALQGWTKLTFWARGEQGGEIAEFKVGGLKNAAGDPCDSLQPSKTTYPLKLSAEWTQYTISLYGGDLSHIAGGFVWVTNAKTETTIYLDEIRFEWSQRR